MALTEYCNICDRRRIESKSESWCCDCEECLCDKCLQDHKAMKMTQYHHVVKITSKDLVDNYHLLSTPNCERHPELKEDLLCKDHDVVCCNGCLVTEHKACKNVVPLNVASIGVKSSELFQVIKRKMVTNKKVSNEVMEERQASKEELKRQETRIRKEIANIKSRFMEHISNLEKSLLSELAAIPKQNTAEIEEDKEKIENIKRQIEADEDAITFVAENGSESQIFLLLRKLIKKQVEIKEKLEKILPISRVTITLEEASHQIEAISSLGFLSVRYESITQSERKTCQSGLLSRQGGVEIRLQIEKEMKIDPKHFVKEEQTYMNVDSVFFLNSYVVNDDNQILVLGSLTTVQGGTKYERNTQLVKYDVDMKFVKSYNIASSNFSYHDYEYFYALTCVPKSQQVVVSDKAGLHFVNSKTMSRMWPSVCFTDRDSSILDLTADTMQIFVLQCTHIDKPKFIKVCDLIGRLLKTIHLDNNMNYTSITLQPNGNFLCMVEPNNSFDFEGSILASVGQDASNIFLYGRSGMNDVIVDRNGSIYMAVEDGIDMMHPCEQEVQRIFTCNIDTAKQVGLEIYKDNSTLCVLYEKVIGTKRLGDYFDDVERCVYSLQVLTAL